jgi:hypothetical protein
MTRPASSATLISVTPMIPSGGSLAEALEFWTGQLGFSVSWTAKSGAGVVRDSVAFNLVENNNREWAENSSFSIGVSDLDAMYAEYQGTPARIGPLEMKAWGRREFHMILPNGVCLQFYQNASA